MVVYRLDTGGFLGGDTDCVLLLFIADHAPEVNDTTVDDHVDRCHCSCPRQLPQIQHYDFSQDFVRFCNVYETQPPARSACTRLARLTMPTSRPSLSTGTRLMPCFSRRLAISCNDVSGSTLITRRVITSLALRPCALTNSAISCSADEKVSSHQERLRSAPDTARRIRSPSEIIPTMLPSMATTGTALMPFATNVFATAFTSNSGPTVMTWEDMTSRAFMTPPPLKSFPNPASAPNTFLPYGPQSNDHGP